MLLDAWNAENVSDKEFILALYERYGAVMYATARKQAPDRGSAEDIVQDSIVRLIGKVSTLRELRGNVLTAYVVYTVRNTAISHRRKRGVRDKLTAEVPPEQATAPQESDPETLLLAAEERARFQQAFSRLPEQERELLTAKYILGSSDKEIAAALGCKPDSVRMRLTRARRHAYELMKGVEERHDEK